MELKLLHNLIDSATLVFPDNEIMQQVAVTQAILESNFLGKDGGSGLAIRANNLFGVKARDKQDFVEMETWEHIDGKDKQVMAKFAKYKDHTECFEAYKELMDHPRYNSVITAPDCPSAFKALVTAGYATDPIYASNLKEIWLKYVLPEFQ